MWGRAEASWSGDLRGGWGAPHNDNVLNITKYLKQRIVLCRTQLVGFPVLKRDFFFLENLGGRKLLGEKTT